MTSRSVVSVPGKLILMGEHAVVYGRPALVAAVDPRAVVAVDDAQSGVEIELADFGRRLRTDWSEVRQRAAAAGRAWRAYAAEPTPEQFAAIGSGTPEDLAMLALGELAAHRDEVALPPMAIRVSSSLPIGSGFGSSAAIAVALIGAVLNRLDGGIDSATVDALALQVERRLHGLPSGVDHKTVLFGGVIEATREADGELHITRLAARSRALERLEIYQTGEPAETTGEVVAAVRRRRDRAPAEVEELLDRMAAAVRRFRQALVTDLEAGDALGTQIRDYSRCLERLGVVPPPVRETIRQVESLGGAAKISGAGSLTGAAAGCLLVHWPAGPPERLPGGLAAARRQAVELGAQGLRLEEEE